MAWYLSYTKFRSGGLMTKGTSGKLGQIPQFSTRFTGTRDDLLQPILPDCTDCYAIGAEIGVAGTFGNGGYGVVCRVFIYARGGALRLIDLGSHGRKRVLVCPLPPVLSFMIVSTIHY